jgi:anti-sigma factor RsiW
MTAHLSDGQIQAYRERSLAAGELLEVSDHIGGCEACRMRVGKPDALSARVRNMRASLQAAAGHVRYEELEAYVDGTMARENRAALEAHTDGCRSCSDDLEAIQAIRRELDAPLAIRQTGSRWAEFWNRLMGPRGVLALAGAAAIVLIAIVLVRAPRNQNVADVAPATNQTPAPGGSVIRDGRRAISIAADGHVTGLDQLAQPDRSALERILAARQIAPAPALSDLIADQGVLLGAPGEPSRGKLLAPLATVVESEKPLFRWEAIAGATYQVSVFDSDFNLAAQSPRLSTTEWQASKPLHRGMRYSWQLSVRQSGAEFTVPVPPAPEARFRVLDEASENEIGRARGQVADSHLLLGILYARAGVLDEAERELEALQSQNPASEEVANLLASVKRMRSDRK